MRTTTFPKTERNQTAWQPAPPRGNAPTIDQAKQAYVPRAPGRLPARQAKPRMRVEDFERIAGNFPAGGKGLEIVCSMDDLNLGFGYNAEGRLEGYHHRTRYNLNLLSSLEWRAMIHGLDETLDVPASEKMAAARWHLELWQFCRSRTIAGPA